MVVFSFGDFGGQGCPHILMVLYWLGGMVFSLMIFYVNKIIKLNFLSHVY
jgi:hypothetical protein